MTEFLWTDDNFQSKQQLHGEKDVLAAFLKAESRIILKEKVQKPKSIETVSVLMIQLLNPMLQE